MSDRVFNLKGTYGEGWFDPWQLVHSIKAKNMHLGVRYCDGEVVNFRRHEFRGVDGEQHAKILGVDVRASFVIHMAYLMIGQY